MNRLKRYAAVFGFTLGTLIPGDCANADEPAKGSPDIASKLEQVAKENGGEEEPCKFPEPPKLVVKLNDETDSKVDQLEYRLKLQEYNHCIAEREYEQRVHELEKRALQRVFFGYSVMVDTSDVLYHGIQVTYRGLASVLALEGGFYVANVDLGGEERSERITLGDFFGGAEPDEKKLQIFLVNLNLAYTPDFVRWEKAGFTFELGFNVGAAIALNYNANTYELVFGSGDTSRDENIDTPTDFALVTRYDLGHISARLSYSFPYISFAIGLKTGYTLQMQDDNIEDALHLYNFSAFGQIGLGN